MTTLKSVFALLNNHSTQEISLCDDMGFDLFRDYDTCGEKGDLNTALENLGDCEVLEIGSYKQGIYICLNVEY